MKTRIVFTLLMLMSIVTVFAQDKNKRMSFEVDGRCEMCKMRIEKAALQVPGVKFASWDIPTHELSVIIDERKTNSMEIKTALVNVGHDTRELKATDEAYEKIHPCCKYRENDSDDSMDHK